MEPESPDWDRSPSVVMETKDEIFEHLPTKSETSPTTEVKPEDTTKEEDSPSNPPFLCPPVSSFPDPTTPPAKAPPVSQTSYRNLSTRAPPLPTLKATSSRKNFPATKPHTPAPPPSNSSSTSSEDPIILTTNVPILPKARPGHPPLNATWVGPSHLPTHPTSLQTPSHTHPPNLSTPPTQGLVQVTIPRPRHNGHILPFNFSSEIHHYLNPTTHRTHQPPLAPTPLPPCPAPQPAYPSSPPTTTGTVFPPVPPIPDTPLTDQQAATLQEAILRIARQAAAAAAVNMARR